MERHLTAERLLSFPAKRRQIAVVEMHGDLDRRIISGGSLVGSGAGDELG